MFQSLRRKPKALSFSNSEFASKSRANRTKTRIPVPIIGHAVASQKIIAVPQHLFSQWGRCDRSKPDSKHIVMY